MATIRTYTADHIDEIANAGIASAYVDNNGHLKLVRNDATEIDAGSMRAPTGSVTMFSGLSVPAGWLVCDGSAVLRTTYGNLFAAIGTRFGAGDNITTFNLPNMVARFAMGAIAAPGESGGSATHGHTIPDHTHTEPNHNHTLVHDHNLEGGSVDAYAQLRIITGPGLNILANRIASPTWTGTQSAEMTNAAGDNTQVGFGTKVSGRTANGSGSTGNAAPATNSATIAANTASSEPPYLSFYFIIKT